MCPDDWRFVYAIGIAHVRGKEDPVIKELRSATSPEGMSLNDIQEFSNYQPFLYKDDQFAIVYDAAADMPLHLLFIPVAHIENLDVLDHLGVLRDMFLAGEFIVKNSSSLKEAYLSISSKKESFQGDYFRHFHLHLQSRDVLDKEELLSLLTPGFYR